MNPYDSLEDDEQDLAEWNGAPLLGRKAIGTDPNHSGPPKPPRPLPPGITVIHNIANNTTVEHPMSASDSCSYCEAMK